LEPPTPPADEMLAEKQPETTTTWTETPPAAEIDDTEAPITEEPVVQHDTIAAVLASAQKESITVTPAAANAPLAFEPLHTVDYFASQGIKFKPEEKPGDRLGMQMKSFTEWLKSMKKLETTQPAENMDDTTRTIIESMAAESVEDRETITEAMAEVLEKQGKTAKAIAVYQKLSLLNPSKSHYFAAKIEQLNK
jgi:hypothetical protein